MLFQMKLRVWLFARAILLLLRIARVHPLPSIATTFAWIIATMKIVVIFVKMIVRALLLRPHAVTWGVSAKKMKTSSSKLILAHPTSHGGRRGAAANLADTVNDYSNVLFFPNFGSSSKWLILPSCAWILMILQSMDQIPL
jgi:hypothetical protein